MPVQYAKGFTIHKRPVPRRGILQLAPGQGADGYGDKISTDYVLRLDGDSRTYRVYAVCHSNVASFYVLKGGEKLFVRDADLDGGKG